MGELKHTADHLLKCWDQYAQTHDDLIGQNSGLFNEIIDSTKELPIINQLIEQFKEIKFEFPDFFSHFKFSWCLYPYVYKNAFEAELQGRIIYMLLSAWLIEKDFLQNLEIAIAVRYAISPKLHLITPKAMSDKDYAFIVIPTHTSSPWFFFLLEKITTGGIQDAKTIIKYLLLRMSCDSKLTNGIMSNGLYFLSPMDFHTHSRAIFQKVEKQLSFFQDVSNVDEISGFETTYWHDSNYLNLNFGLAHELAHILRGEHISSTQTDEFSTDRLGLELLENTSFYKQTLKSSHLVNHKLLGIYSAALFLEMIHFQTNCEVRLLHISKAKLTEIENRRNTIYSLIKKEDLVFFSDLFRAVNHATSLLDEIIQTFESIECEISKTATEHIQNLSS